MSSLEFERCDDGHMCHNGSKCVQVKSDEGTFTCDCEAITGDDEYAGLKCEHQATVNCRDQDTISASSFCTNGGTCTENVSPITANFVCDCPKGYMGDHCEFIDGQTLPDHVAQSITNPTSSSSNNGGLSGGAVAAIVLVVLGSVLAVGLYLIRHKLRRWDPTDVRNTEASPDLVLEADGSILTNAVKSGAGVNSPTFSSTTTTASSSSPSSMEEHASNVFDDESPRVEVVQQADVASPNVITPTSVATADSMPSLETPTSSSSSGPLSPASLSGVASPPAAAPPTPPGANASPESPKENHDDDDDDDEPELV